ncbi:MAG: geranyl transferase, partial [Acidobacteria bacterium]
HGLDGARGIAASLRAQAREAIAPLGARTALLDALATLIVDRNA